MLELRKWTTEEVAKMPQQDQTDLFNQVELSQVIRAYSGRPGCACGCRGNYRCASDHVQQGSADRGYLIDPDDINDSQVARVFNLMKTHADKVAFFGSGFSLDLNDKNRSYAVYLPEKSRDEVLQWHVRCYATLWVKNGSGREFSHWNSAAGAVMQLKGDGLLPPRSRHEEEVKSPPPPATTAE